MHSAAGTCTFRASHIVLQFLSARTIAQAADVYGYERTGDKQKTVAHVWWMNMVNSICTIPTNTRNQDLSAEHANLPYCNHAWQTTWVCCNMLYKPET